MVFIEKVLLLCCLPILLAIVMPINCNKFNSQIDQSLKRFPRQVNANNDQQIGANDTHSLVNYFGTSIQSGFDVRQGGKNVMHDKSSGPAILPGRNNERRGRQLNIYSQVPFFCVDCVHEPRVLHFNEDVELHILLRNYNVKSGLIDYDDGSRCAINTQSKSESSQSFNSNMNRDNELPKGSRLGINGPKIPNTADNATSSSSADPGITSINETLAAQTLTKKQSKDDVPVTEEMLQEMKTCIDLFEKKLESAGYHFDAEKMRPKIDPVMSQNKKERRSAFKDLTRYKDWIIQTLSLLRQKKIFPHRNPASKIDENPATSSDTPKNPASKMEENTATSSDTPFIRQTFDRSTPLNVKKGIRLQKDEVTVEDKNANIPPTVLKHKLATAINTATNTDAAESEFVAKKIENGQLYKRHASSWGGAKWYLQTNKVEPSSLQPVGKQGRRILRCNVCNTVSKSTARRNFHSKYAHNGGKQCDKCPFIGFTLAQFDQHIPHCSSFNSKELRLEIGSDGNVVEGHGCILKRVLAIPFCLDGKTELWIGTTHCHTAISGAETAVSLVENAKKNDFANENDPYCPSLAELMYPNASKALQWKPDKENAFFFVGNFGGTIEATEYAKYFIREVYNCNAHRKPHNNLRIRMQHMKAKMLKELSEQSNIPERHMKYLRDNYLNKTTPTNKEAVITSPT